MKALGLFVGLGGLLLAANVRADDETPHWVEHNFARQHAALMHKVRTLIIPKIDWNNLTVKEVLNDLSDKCKEADLEHKGISFVGASSLANAPFTISVHAANKSLLEVLKSLPYPFVIGRDAVSLYYDAGEGICRTQFYVPQNYFKSPPENAGKGVPGAFDVAPQLAAKGVGFPAGSQAIYLPDREKLIVVGGRDLVEKVDELLNP